mgnify:CR=1 FL=1
MARIQFTPATKSKGFDPIQISTASITRMREEADRVVQNMEKNRAAELKQRTEDFQAMQANDAYTESITRENNAIELQNEQNNLNAALSNLRIGQEQATIDQQAMQSFFDLVKNVSKTAAAKSVERTAKQLADQTDNANAIELSTVIPSEKLLESEQAELSLTKASIINEQNIIENGVETGESYKDTVRALATEAGLGHIGDKVFHNRIFDETQKITMGRRLQSNEAIYDLGDGTKFSGMEALSDPDKLSIVQAATTRDVVKFMRKSFGITSSAYFNPANEKIQKRNATARVSATKKDIEFSQEIGKEKIAALMDSGTAQNITKGFQTAKNIFGPKIAHDMLIEAGLRGNDTMRAVIGNLDLNANGKAYKNEWTNRYGPMMVSARKQFIDDQKFQDDFLAAKYRGFENENEVQIFSSMDVKPEETMQKLEEEAASFRTSVSKHFKDRYASIIRKTDEDAIAQYNDRFNKKGLDLTFINNLPFKHREAAMELYDEQEKERYGEDYEGIKEKFETTAKAMTTGKIDAQFGTSMTYLFQAEMEKRFDFHFKETRDAKTALGLMMDEVNAGRAGTDKTSIFYRMSAQGVNAFSFPNLEKGNIELLERVRNIDNNLKTKGAAVLDEAYLVSSEEEMDATYASSEIGVTNYSAGIYLVRDRLNANPAYKDNPLTLPEVFNRQRMANNLKSGRNAPLIMTNATQDSLASLPTNVSKLFEDNKPPMMKLRGQKIIESHILGTPLPKRGEAKRSFTGALTYESNEQVYRDVGTVLERLNFKVAEHSDFGDGSIGKHSPNSYHYHNEAFDVTHWDGQPFEAVSKGETIKLKENIRSLGLFKEVIGPGDGDPNHATHLHLGGLLRPITEEDIMVLNSIGN